jgi:PST family polysaccharide transporter
MYNRANALAGMPASQVLRPLMGVLQPVFARLSDDPDRLRRTALSMVRKVSLLAMFATIATIPLADLIIRVVLGPGWDAAVDLFRLLAIFTFVQPVAELVIALLIARGAAGAVVKWKFITLSIIVAASATGALWGVKGIVAAYAISGLFIRLPLLFAFSSRYLPISVGEFIGAIVPALVPTLASTLMVLALRAVFEPRSPYVATAILLPAFAICYLGVALAWRSTRQDILEVVHVLVSARTGGTLDAS